jgi:2-polyprenyl-6-methoxyphenol hydroxylase-like FAD-dependent oxidoreductase
MHELGVLDEFLRRPHQEARTLGAQIGGEFLQVADFQHLPTHCRFIALMPQWDFLDFLAEKAKRHPSFQLQMGTEVRDLIVEGGHVIGLRAETRRATRGQERSDCRGRRAPLDLARTGRLRGH